MAVDILQDVRIALRGFVARPVFTLVAIATVALAIGANTIVFSVVNGILLRPLPYANADRLVSVWPSRSVSFEELLYLREHAASFADIGGIVPSWSMTLTGESQAAKLRGARVTTNLFSVLGVSPDAGRPFVENDQTVGLDRTVMMSAGLWRGRFGGDPDLIGGTLTLDGESHAVVGAMPPGFEIFQPHTEIWRVLALDRGEWYYRGGSIQLVGRLRGGVTVQEARAELRALAVRMGEALGKPDAYGETADVVPLHDRVVGSVRPMLLVTLGAVGFVLLLAGTNLANMLLARSASRRGEMAVRTALGASPGRLARQLLTETTVLSCAGGVVGCVLAYWGLGIVIAMLPADTPRGSAVDMNVTVLAVSAALTLLTGLLFGVGPAASAVRSSPIADLRAGPAGSGARPRRRRWQARTLLVTSEVTLGMVLLVGAALMLQTLWKLSRVDPGFRFENVLTFELQPTGGHFESGTQRVAYYQRLFERLGEMPGVQSTGAIQHLPLTGSGWSSEIEVEGRPVPTGASPPSVGWRIVGGEYFRTLEIPVLAGRSFDARDRPDVPPVVIVNESMASRLWPGGPAIGRRIRARNATGGEWATVIGVVGDIRHRSLQSDAIPELYRPITQHPHGGMTVAVRTEGDPARSATAVMQVVQSMDRTVPISNVRTYDRVISASVAQPRTILVLLGAFALLGVVMGAVGTYGVVAYLVSTRTREIGIRIALGARPESVIRGFLAAGLRPAVLGAILGGAAALVLTRALRGFVYEIGIGDPATYAVVGAVLILVTGVASYIPARRASVIDPMAALREP